MKEKLRDLCELSIIAYDDTNTFSRVTELGYELIEEFSEDEVDGYFVEDDNNLILVFKGSESITQCPKDWLTNFYIKKTRTLLGDVHTGFYEGVMRIYSKYNHIITKSNKNVILTGHSQGGGLAALYGLQLKTYGTDCIVVTFGQPRVGGKSFVKTCKNLELPFIRVENSNDIVCKVPLQSFTKFKHYQSEHIYFNRNGKLIVNPKFGRLIVDFITDFVARPLDIAMDHMVNEYRILINKHF